MKLSNTTTVTAERPNKPDISGVKITGYVDADIADKFIKSMLPGDDECKSCGAPKHAGENCAFCGRSV